MKGFPRIIIVIGWLFWGSLSYGFMQDSLLQQLQKARPHQQAAILQQLGEIHYEKQDFDAALLHSQQAYKKAVEHQQWELAIQSLMQISTVHHTLGHTDSAHHYLNSALDIADRHQLHTAEIDLLHTKSRLLFDTGNWEEGIQVARKALVLSLQTKEGGSLSESYLLLGNAYKFINEQDSAIYYYRKELTIPLEESIHRATVQMNLGIIYDLQGQSDTALSYYLEALRFVEAKGDTISKANVLANLGTFYDDRGDAANALKYYQEADDMMIKVQNYRNSTIIKYNIVQLLLRLNRLSEAERYLDTILDYSMKTGFIEMEIRIHISQSNLYLARKEYQTATEILEQALEDHRPKMTMEVFSELLSTLALSYYHNDRLSEAAVVADSAYRIAQEIGISITMLKALEVQSKVLMQQGNFQKSLQIAKQGLSLATEGGYLDFILPFTDNIMFCLNKLRKYDEFFQYYEMYKTYSDSIYSLDKQQIISMQLLNVKEKEFNEVQSQLALNQSKLELKEEQIARRNILVGGIFLVSITLLIFAVTYYMSTEKVKEINQQLRKRHQQIQEQNKELERLSTEKEKLISIMAHDLRSPVNNILSLTELMTADKSLTAKQQHYLSMITRSATRSEELIHHLLQSQKEKKELPLSPAGPICEEIVANYLSNAESKNITVTFINELTPGQEAMVPTSSYHRLLDNLVSNAIKFSTKGKEVIVTLSAGNQHILTSVQDSGPGFSTQDQEVLFTPYAKRSAQPTGDEYSIGLGLSIIKSLVDQMKGTIELETSPNGSTFTVSLPNAT